MQWLWFHIKMKCPASVHTKKHAMKSIIHDNTSARHVGKWASWLGFSFREYLYILESLDN